MLVGKSFLTPQMAPKNHQNFKRNNGNTPCFKGDVYSPVKGKLYDLVDANPDLQYAIKLLKEELQEKTNKTLNIFIRDIERSKAKAIPVSTYNSALQFESENANLIYFDTATGVEGSIGFYMNPQQGPMTNFANLYRTVKDVVAGSFIK